MLLGQGSWANKSHPLDHEEMMDEKPDQTQQPAKQS